MHITGYISIYLKELNAIFIEIWKIIENINPSKSVYGQYSWLQLYCCYTSTGPGIDGTVTTEGTAAVLLLQLLHTAKLLLPL